jgi:SAM-dependent methyltransferase
MDQEAAWEAEYRKPQMLTRKNVPHADVVRFMRALKKRKKKEGEPIDITEWHVLDLGSGTGRNSFYFAEQGATVTGYEFSDTAISLAERFAKMAELPITYRKQDIGAPYPLKNASINLVLDVMSSNSLNTEGRNTYLHEVRRVLKPGAHLFVRALSKDGDQHAKYLVEHHPGLEPDTYMHPDLGICEKVFTEKEFRDTYGAYFTIESLERAYHYVTSAGRKYKRAYWLAHMTKNYAV